MTFMATRNQKPITDVQKIKEKKCKHNTKESHQITMEDKRKQKERVEL